MLNKNLARTRPMLELTLNQSLVQLTDHVCPGYEVIYECTVCGEGATVWRGSLLECPGDQINLRHSQFESCLANGECNNGAVIARNTGFINIDCTQCYISQLRFLANDVYDNKTIFCYHFNGTSETIIGVDTVTLIRGTH